MKVINMKFTHNTEMIEFLIKDFFGREILVKLDNTYIIKSVVFKKSNKGASHLIGKIRVAISNFEINFDKKQGIHINMLLWALGGN